MSVVQRSVCQIDSLNLKGLGVSVISSGVELSNKAIELPYVLPDELIEFEEHIYRNKTSFIVSKIIKTSVNRVVPPCKYFTICGGCLLQHLNTDYYYHHKLQILQKSLQDKEIKAVINPIKSIGPSSRRRASFEAVKKHDQVFLGFKKYHSEMVVNIDSCLVLLPELSSLITELKIVLQQILVNKEQCKILLTKADNGIDLIIEVGDGFELSNDKVQLIKDFSIKNSIIKANIITKKWNIVHCSQQPYIIFGNAKVAVDSYSFLQVSKASDIILVELIYKILINISENFSKKLRIIDLFCGRGTLTLPTAKFGTIDGFEIEKSAVKALKDAGEKGVSVYERDLFIDPVRWDELSRYDIAIINPPRAGAKEQSKALAQSSVQAIIYLSCDIASFSRDAQIILQSKRYVLQEITPIDQFFWSNHLEIFAVFIRE